MPSPDIARLAAVRERLTSDDARAAWRTNLRAALEAVLTTRVGDLVDRRAIAVAASALFAPNFVESAAAPLLERALAQTADWLASDPCAAGVYVPASTRRKLDELVELPNVLPGRLVRIVLEHDASHEVLREILFDALKEFNERVNPFFADWGLPALLKRLGPFGLGAMGKTFEGLRAEFDRRLEPEIRRFLVGFSRSATKKTADYVVDKIDAPTFVAVRKQLASRLLEEKLAEIVPRASDDRSRLAREVAVEMAAHLLGREQARAAFARGIERWVDAHADKSLREALASIGVTAGPDAEALADATWPVVKAALASDVVVAWLAATSAPRP